MDFLLLIFHRVRYFKILRKSENGSKTKMDFFRAGATNRITHPIVCTIFQSTITDFPHMLTSFYWNFLHLPLTFYGNNLTTILRLRYSFPGTRSVFRFKD